MLFVSVIHSLAFFFQIAAMHFQFLAVACLMAVVRSRRHLCDDLTLPDCTNGDKADYNPTGENRWGKQKNKHLSLNQKMFLGAPLARMGLRPPAQTAPTQL